MTYADFIRTPFLHPAGNKTCCHECCFSAFVFLRLVCLSFFCWLTHSGPWATLLETTKNAGEQTRPLQRHALGPEKKQMSSKKNPSTNLVLNNIMNNEAALLGAHVWNLERHSRMSEEQSLNVMILALKSNPHCRGTCKTLNNISLDIKRHVIKHEHLTCRRTNKHLKRHASGP